MIKLRFTFPVALLLIVSACGSAPQALQRGPASSTSTMSGGASSTFNTIVVETPEGISSLPFEIGPLPDGVAPRLTVADAFDAVAASLDARFFASDADKSAAVVKVGFITDKGGTEDGSANSQLQFPGYVIEGGHSTCTPSGPPGSDGGREDPIPCHALVIVNGNTGEMPRFGEISDPASPSDVSG